MEVSKMEEHIEYLQNLGLTEYQAKTMLVLFAQKQETAEGICRHFNEPRKHSLIQPPAKKKIYIDRENHRKHGAKTTQRAGKKVA